jgi:hypothetical protein
MKEFEKNPSASPVVIPGAKTNKEDQTPSSLPTELYHNETKAEPAQSPVLENANKDDKNLKPAQTPATHSSSEPKTNQPANKPMTPPAAPAQKDQRDQKDQKDHRDQKTGYANQK